MAIIGRIEDLPEGKMMKAKVGGEEICIANVGGKLFAVQHSCAHTGGPLSQGKLDGKVLTCPWHWAKFDVTTGKCISGPMGGPPVKDLKVYKAKTVGEDIMVEK